MKKKIKPNYVPVVKSLGDVSNFDEYPDSGVSAQDIKPSLDPFLSWWMILILIILFFWLIVFIFFYQIYFYHKNLQRISQGDIKIIYGFYFDTEKKK